MKHLTLFTIVFALTMSACSSPTPAPLPTSAPVPAQPPAQPTTVPATQAPQPTAAPTQSQPTATQLAATTAPTQPAATAVPTQPPASPTAAAPKVASMLFEDFKITPSQLKISVGTTVVFNIKGGLLSFHQPYSSFPNNTNTSGLFEAPANLGNGTTYQFTFRQAGVITVRCGYHPDMMVATIEVTP